MAPSVAAVIPAYNGVRFLPALLDSLRAQSLPLAGVFVVDNASADGTGELVRSRYPEATLLPQARNLGFGRACNAGIRHALGQGADHVLLVNQDMILSADTCAGLAALMERHPDLGMLAPFQLSYDGQAVDLYFRPLLSKELLDDLYFERLGLVYRVPFVPAAALLIRREVFEQVGGFDPLFFMYGEDNDLCRRVVHVGWQLGVAPGTTARHWNGLANANRSLSWECRWAHSRALLHLKASPRWLPLAFASLLTQCPPRLGVKALAAWAYALGRCLARARTIALQRRAFPRVVESPQIPAPPSARDNGRARTPAADSVTSHP